MTVLCLRKLVSGVQRIGLSACGGKHKTLTLQRPHVLSGRPWRALSRHWPTTRQARVT